MWMGNIGGLQQSLAFIGSIFVGWFASFNAGGFLMSQLYSQST